MDEMWMVIVGAFLPPAIDFINRYIKDQKMRFVVAMAAAFVVGLVLSWLQLGSAVFENFAVVFATSQAVYKLIYEKTAMQLSIRGDA